MKLSLIVPCYNEEGNILKFYEKVKDSFDQQIYDYEIIFINDGSRDNTLKEIKEIYHRCPEVRSISFSRNFGKEAAIYAGLQNVKGEYTGIIDADLQQSPKLLVEMVKYLDVNAEIDSVAAVQKERREKKILIFFKNSFYKIINKISEIDFVSGASDFRVCRRNVVDAILDMPEYYRFSKGIFAWIGFETHYISYQADERASGESKWGFWRLVKYALDGMMAFSTAPLKLASSMGLVISLLSGVYMIVVIIQKLFFSINIKGYPTIICLILLLGGIQLLVNGIFGEYLAKTYVQGKKRPIYIVKESLNHEEEMEEE